MTQEQDSSYFDQRERAERAMAMNATNAEAKATHLALADSYRHRARRVRQAEARRAAPPSDGEVLAV